MIANTLSIREAMVRVADMACDAPPPRRYALQAVWWRLYAKESANPTEPLSYARNLYRLAAHMSANPALCRIKPEGRTDWQQFVRLIPHEESDNGK